MFWLASALPLVTMLFLMFSRRPENKEALSSYPQISPSNYAVAPSGTAIGSSKQPVSIAIGTSELTEGERILSALSTEGGIYRLSPSELAKYIASNGSNSFSLVAAYETSRNQEYIKLAAQLHPDDPLVQSKIVLHNVFPEERQKWLDALKKSAPENSLPNLLAARDLLDKGDVDRALREISEAKNKKMDDYFRETATGLKEAYIEAGVPITEAKVYGAAEVLLPHLAQIKKTAFDLRDRAEAYGAQGDAESQKMLLAGAYAMSQHVRNSGEKGPLITELVGVAIENKILSSWPKGESVPFLSNSPEEQLRLNQDLRDSAKTNTRIFDAWMRQAPSAEIVAFQDRVIQYGERDAFKWLSTKYPNLQPSPEN